MKKVIYLIALCLVVVMAVSCGKQSSDDVNTGQLKSAGTQSPALAAVDGEVITLADFNERVTNLNDEIRAVALENKAAYLDNLVLEILLYKEALKRNIDKDKEMLDIFEEAKKRIIIARLAKDEVEDKAKVNDRDIKVFYDDNKVKFMSPELYRASHILVDTLDEAVEISDKLNAGALFTELARKHSSDTTSARGGDIGYFSKGQMVPEFEDACLKLRTGDVSGPVKTQFGYHVIKLTDKKPSEPMKFESVKDKIESDLLSKRRAELLDDLITRLKSKASIVINSDLLEMTKDDSQS